MAAKWVRQPLTLPVPGNQFNPVCLEHFTYHFCHPLREMRADYSHTDTVSLHGDALGIQKKKILRKV